MKKVELNSKELKETLTHLILNNRALQEDNLKPVAISICGPAGLGKTSVVEQLAEELDIKHVEIINLAQLDELGDLVGIPVKESRCIISVTKVIPSLNDSVFCNITSDLTQELLVK